MICPNCGGDFADWAPKCPYCGEMNYQGAEREYMERLEMLRQDLEEIPEESGAHYRKRIGTTMGKLLRRLSILVGVVVVLAVLRTAWERHQEKKYEDRTLRMYAWEQENFPVLDQWYEAGEYDEILDFERRLWAKNSEFGLYRWEHYLFVTDYYRPYAECLRCRQALTEGEIPSEEMVCDALIGGIFLACHTTEEKIKTQVAEKERWGQGLSEEEARLIADYCTAAKAVLCEDMGFTESEMAELYRNCLDKEGYMRYAPCYEYADVVMERMGWED